ncbi:type II secretion system F family protein [Jatrophihabitans sp.]|uniref:type II secretion system F family protein n=1 Tax=Jatrophihabitans sp. TaxID=1932789 RepID=UPI002BF88BC6|nr:type II secretion system F family protein [Jatrophihabitans sp.]
MPGLTLALLGFALLLAPAPALAVRRLAWLAGRGNQPAPDAPPGPAASTRLLPAGWNRVLVAGRKGEHCRAELAAIVTVLRDEYAAGATIAAAFAAAAALPGRFRTALAHAAALAWDGREVAPALTAEPRLAALAVACDLAGRNGAPLAPSLAGVHAELVADQRTSRAVRTALAGPRSSALLLAGLPVLGMAMGSAMGARPQRVLLHTGAGRLALGVGLALELAGLAWTLALSRRALAGTRS